MNLVKATLSAAIGTALVAGQPSAGQSEPTVPEVSKQGLRVEGTRELEKFGASASGIGDFNGDGFADFAVGRIRPAMIRGLPARTTQVVFGDAGSAPVSAGDINGRGITIFNPDSPGYIGDSVSGAGDVNGDGFSDLIISANIVEPSVSVERVAFVVFGNTNENDVNLAALGTGGFRIDVTEVPGTEGLEVAGVGDVNGDGLDDIAIGLRGAGTATTPDAGRAYVVFGSADLDTIDVENLGSRGFVVDGANEGDQLGFSIAGAGDVNGDGLDDVVIGLPTYDRLGTDGSGKAVVVFGDDTNTNVDIANLNGRGFQVLGVASEDFAGFEVAGIGDFNGDGFADVGVGSILRFGSQRTVPEAYVVFGQPIPSDVDLTSASPVWLPIYGTDQDAFFGQRISAAGDMNGDGLGDVLIGAERAPFSVYGAGRGFVIFGKTGASPIDLAVQTDAGFVYVGEPGTALGSEVSAAGDINGDGLNDLVIGAYGVQFQANTRAGAVFIPYNKNIQSVSAMHLLRTRFGDAPKQGVGSLGDRSNHGFPAADIWLDFDDGDTSSGSASSSTITVLRPQNELAKTSVGQQWRIETDRLNWTNLDVQIRLANDSSPNFPAPSLAVYFSQDGQAPFSPLDSTIDFDRKTISARINMPGFLQIGVRDPIFANGFE